uniref:Uncharacterized protein n=1 Tax=viral metagenome TaxID=1070528 RepID=A0A6C0CBY4_9ZZZZ
MNTTNVAKIQELAKLFDTTVSEINNPGLHDGTNVANFFDFLILIPGIEAFVGPEYYKLMQKELELAEEKKNKREHVKKLYMFPNFDYAGWTNVDIDDEILNIIIEKLNKMKFSFKISDGKVNVIPDEGDMCKQIFELLKMYLDPSVRQNADATHVTVVNSNIVGDIGQDKVAEFVKGYDKHFELKFGKVKSTVSRDWSLFSLCYVIEVNSEYLDEFVAKFNEKFEKKIRPSPHITFATKVRSV